MNIAIILKKYWYLRGTSERKEVTLARLLSSSRSGNFKLSGIN
jgi:hypothetical protein